MIRHTEGFASIKPNAEMHEFDTCPLCHSVLDHDQAQMENHLEIQPHQLGDGNSVENGRSNK